MSTLEQKLKPMAVQFARQSRDDALQIAITTCDQIAKDGGTAGQCVIALTLLRSMMPPVDQP